jgi:hypothetical protein
MVQPILYLHAKHFLKNEFRLRADLSKCRTIHSAGKAYNQRLLLCCSPECVARLDHPAMQKCSGFGSTRAVYYGCCSFFEADDYGLTFPKRILQCQHKSRWIRRCFGLVMQEHFHVTDRQSDMSVLCSQEQISVIE